MSVKTKMWNTFKDQNKYASDMERAVARNRKSMEIAESAMAGGCNRAERRARRRNDKKVRYEWVESFVEPDLCDKSA